MSTKLTHAEFAKTLHFFIEVILYVKLCNQQGDSIILTSNDCTFLESRFMYAEKLDFFLRNLNKYSQFYLHSDNFIAKKHYCVLENRR